jgi:hypothetical protein
MGIEIAPAIFIRVLFGSENAVRFYAAKVGINQVIYNFLRDFWLTPCLVQNGQTDRSNL